MCGGELTVLLGDWGSRPRGKRTVLIDAPLGARAGWARVRGFVARVLEEKRDDAVRRHGVRGEVAHRGAVVGVGPEVLLSSITRRLLSAYIEEADDVRTRTEYCLPALSHGDSVRLKNISAGSSRVLI